MAGEDEKGKPKKSADAGGPPKINRRDLLIGLSTAPALGLFGYAWNKQRGYQQAWVFGTYSYDGGLANELLHELSVLYVGGLPAKVLTNYGVWLLVALVARRRKIRERAACRLQPQTDVEAVPRRRHFRSVRGLRAEPRCDPEIADDADVLDDRAQGGVAEVPLQPHLVRVEPRRTPDPVGPQQRLDRRVARGLAAVAESLLPGGAGVAPACASAGVFAKASIDASRSPTIPRILVSAWWADSKTQGRRIGAAGQHNVSQSPMMR